MQKSCFSGPTIFKIPQPNWHYKDTEADFGIQKCALFKVPYLYYFLPQIFKYSAVPVTFIKIHSTFVLGKPVLHTIYYMVL